MDIQIRQITKNILVIYNMAQILSFVYDSNRNEAELLSRVDEVQGILLFNNNRRIQEYG